MDKDRLQLVPPPNQEAASAKELALRIMPTRMKQNEANWRETEEKKERQSTSSVRWFIYIYIYFHNTNIEKKNTSSTKVTNWIQLDHKAKVKTWKTKVGQSRLINIVVYLRTVMAVEHADRIKFLCCTLYEHITYALRSANRIQHVFHTYTDHKFSEYANIWSYTHSWSSLQLLKNRVFNMHVIF